MIFAVVGIWLSYEVISTSLLNERLAELPVNIFDVISVITCIGVLYCELCRIWRGDYEERDAIAIAIFALMAGSFHLLGMHPFFIDSLLVFAARNEHFRKLLGFSTAVVAFWLAIVITCMLIGAVNDETWIRVAASGEVHVRHSLGFYYCLFAPQHLFAITCCACWLRNQKLTFVEAILLIACNAAMYAATDSRLSFGLSVLAVLLTFIRRLSFRWPGWQAIARICSWSFPTAVAITVAAVISYALFSSPNVTVFNDLNAMLGGRLSLTFSGLTNIGWQLFGQTVEWHGAGSVGVYDYVDNMYAHSLIERGLIYTTGLIALYTATCRKAIKINDFAFPLIIAVIALHGIIDDLALILAYNPMLLALGSYLTSTNNNQQDTRGKHAQSEDPSRLFAETKRRAKAGERQAMRL